MRTFLHIMILFFLLPSCYGQKQERLLKNTYRHKSIEELESFCDSWSNEISPITDNNLSSLNDTLNDIYKVMQSFYVICDLLNNDFFRIDSIENTDRFILLPTKVNYIYIADRVFYDKSEADSIILVNLLKEYDEDTADILDLFQNDKGDFGESVYDRFGPKSDYLPENKPLLIDSNINVFPKAPNKEKTLYLTSDYYILLSNFLLKDNPFRRRIFTKRIEFLQNSISIYPWQMMHSTYINSITFSKDMEYAELNFNYGYIYGMAFFKKSGMNWSIIKLKQLNPYY